MADLSTKLPAKAGQAGVPALPFNTLRREIDRFFDDFGGRAWRRSFDWPLLNQLATMETLAYAPAMDVVEKKDAFEITAEVPGMEEKDIEVKLANGGIFIRGEKKSDREEKRANYYLSERNYGSFDRYFTLPNGVDAEKISASFKNGVLTVTLPKTVEAQKGEKRIPVTGN